MQPDDLTPAHLPALIPSPTAVLHRAQATLGLLREVVQESSAEYWYERGKDDAARKEWQEAIICYNTCLEYNSNHWQALIARGRRNISLHNYEAALTDYKRASKLHPEAIRKIALSVVFIGFLAGAINHEVGIVSIFDFLIEFNPENPNYHGSRGNIKFAFGDIAGSIVDYSRAIFLAPDDAYYYSRRADVKKQSGDFVGAATDWQKAQELETDREVEVK